MCMTNTDKTKYEVILFDKDDNYICCINFASVTVLCKFLEDVDFDNCHLDIYRRSDHKVIDKDVLLSIWRTDFYDCEV